MKNPFARGPQSTTPYSARPYVVAWRLAHKKVVVVGAGAIGEAKIETLLPAQPNIVAIDPTPSQRVRELAASGQITLFERRVCPLDLRGTTLVVIATGCHDSNARIAKWARLFRVTVNAVDDPALCDVTIPAVIERGPATIAITTNGATPAGARFLREQLSTFVHSDFGSVFEHASTARHQLRSSGAYRYDYSAWRDRFFTPAWESLKAGNSANIADIREEFVGTFESELPGGKGRISLVGAGPGGHDLITVRGAQALRTADVVLYDRLADPSLLELAPRAALRVPVGKGKGFGHSQSSIEQLLVEHASAGSHVVRLKGGDPFVFGRGCEEVDAAKAHGIPVEVVPGLSSALSAPALAGLSITNRNLSSGFVVISGHRAGPECYDWDALARLELTLVVLMAAGNAEEVAQRLIDAGADATTGVAFIHAAGQPEQESAQRCLSEVSKQGCPFGSPSVMVIGAVVGQAVSSTREAVLL